MNKAYILMILVSAVIVTSGCTSSTEKGEITDNILNDQPKAPDQNRSERPETQTEADRNITVEGGNYYFEPDVINVSMNETVRFVFENEGGTHDMRIPEFGVGTEIIQGGDNQGFTVTFEEEGSYEFICSVGNHAARGMTGTIEVR